MRTRKSQASLIAPLPWSRTRVLAEPFSLWGARVAQWWEHSPPTDMARVQIPASTPYVGWVCCWFSPLLREVFSPGTPVFASPQKPTFPNSNSTRNRVDEEPLCGCATCKSLFFIFIIIYLFLISPAPHGLNRTKLTKGKWIRWQDTNNAKSLGKIATQTQPQHKEWLPKLYWYITQQNCSKGRKGG